MLESQEGKGSVDRGAFLTLPSNCEESPQAREAQVEIDTWKEPGVMHEGSTEAFPSLEGCNLLNFTSTLSVSPETTQAEAPSGYELGLKVPQAPNGGTGLGTPPLKNYSLTLPAGTTLAPGAAHHLVACQETGPEGINIEGAESEEIATDGLQRPAAGHCPKGSAIAAVKTTSPLLREPLEGHLFVAQPECGGEGQEACTQTHMRRMADSTGSISKCRRRKRVWSSSSRGMRWSTRDGPRLRRSSKKTRSSRSPILLSRRVKARMRRWRTPRRAGRRSA